MKSFNRMLGVAAACLMLAGVTSAEARGGGFAGGGPRFVPHAPYVGNGYRGRVGPAVGGYTFRRGGFFGGRRFGPGAALLGLGAAGALGYGAYEYGGDYGYGYPYEDSCTRATGNPYRCNSYQYGY